MARRAGSRHRGPAAFGAVGIHLDREDFGRGEGGGDEFLRFVAVFDDVDLLPAEFVHDSGHTGAPGADTGPNGIDVFIMCLYRELGAEPASRETALISTTPLKISRDLLPE